MPISPLDILCILLVISGLVFFLGASVGLLRFPDFYTRMHAAGKGDTLSTLLIMAGAGVYELHRFDPADGSAISVILIVIKIMAIGVFIMLTSPTSTHALMQAGYDDQIEPAGDDGELRLQTPELGEPAADAQAGDTVSPPVAATKTSARRKSPARKKPAAGKKKVAGASKKSPAKKAATKKTPAKKAAKKKAAAKKAATKKAAAKKTPAKKAAAKKIAAKKSTKKAATAKKKSPGKKAAAKKKSPRSKEN